MLPLNPLLCTAGLSRLSLLSHPALLQSWNLSSQQSYSNTRQQHTNAAPSGQETRTAYEHCAQLVRSVWALLSSSWPLLPLPPRLTDTPCALALPSQAARP